MNTFKFVFNSYFIVYIIFYYIDLFLEENV